MENITVFNIFGKIETPNNLCIITSLQFQSRENWLFISVLLLSYKKFSDFEKRTQRFFSNPHFPNSRHSRNNYNVGLMGY